jgi:pimeloyl-ACP methyl ester carboxylesterase
MEMIGRAAGIGTGVTRQSARHRVRGLLIAATALGALLDCALLAGATPASVAAATTVEYPVTFQVRNTDTSQAPCPPGTLAADGATYTIRGHISGPRAALESGKAHSITVYLFGYEAGEWNWDLKGVPGYDYAAEMAGRGHVSLTLDELGYGASGHPENGNQTCQGAEADITHQIVQKLRKREYTLGEHPGIEFSNVVLAGHDVGGEVAEIEAYSYKDVDGLILVTFADQGFTPYITERSTISAFDTCTESASGYVHFISDEEFRTLPFYNADPAVIEAADAQRNPNPCGIIRSTPPSVIVDDHLYASEIEVPVLIVFGDDDTLVWSRQGEEEQEGNFTGSSDKSTVFIPEAGHFVMFARTAPVFDAVISRWLGSRFAMP